MFKSLILAAGLAYANAFPSMDVTIDGQPDKLYITEDWFTLDVEGASVKLGMNMRAYLTRAADMGQLDTMGYYTPNLLGGSLEWDNDISAAQCGCVDTFYLVGMPATNWDGSKAADKFHYCDANQVGGFYCPEFDMMESNLYSWRSTIHKCNQPNDQGHYDWCDAGGSCAIDFQQQEEGAYGQGAWKIDTTRPFHSKINFAAGAGDRLDSFTVELTQEGRTYTIGSCGDDTIGKDLKGGMAFVLSTWGSSDGIDWLQHGKC